MSTSPHLERLVRIGQLKAEPSARAEIEGLIGSGCDRLQDAQTETLTLSGRFDLAYNSAHALSLAALRSHGYRSEHRYIVFQCLEHTLNLPPEMWRVLDQAHRKRNVAEYEGMLDVDRALVDALIRVAKEIEARVKVLALRPRFPAS